ncbi:hypothetical protein DFR78_1563, partial [Halanaerobium sp. MA284_MarDTE_T2]
AFVKRKMYHPTNRIVYHLVQKREGEEITPSVVKITGLSLFSSADLRADD